ncbi:MAG TPA: hypothetical protein VH989_06495 [Actinomycetota bacterium]
MGPVRRLGWAVIAVVLVACNGSTSDATSPTPGATISFTTEPSTVAPSPSASPLPSPVEVVQHGGSYWAVYLGVGDPGSAELRRAERRAADLGLTAAAGDLSCDEGAAESLGVEPGTFGVGVYFEREADAIAFAAALEGSGPVHGPVPVKTFCAD